MSATYPDLPYTNMPDKVDDLIVYENVTQSTKPIVDQFEAYLNAGEFVNANNYYNQNKNVLQKIIVNENTINKLMQSIIALERFYLNDVQNYMQAISAEQNLLPIKVVTSLPSDAASHPNQLYLTYE